MDQEIAATFALTLVVGLIGLPISLWLKRYAVDAPAYAHVALAPAFGIAITALIAAPAYMYLGPAEVWGWPMLALLLMGAALAMGRLIHRPEITTPHLFDLGTLIAAIAIACICLLTPALAGGVNRTVFNTNPSDSFMYLTLAETTRTASWEQLRGFAEDTSGLLRQNPLALYSARFVGRIMRITTFADLGWFSQVTNLGVERLLWAFAFAMSAATAAAAWGVARLIRIQAGLAALVALVVTVGFWGAMPREADAYSNLQATPLLLAMVALRIADAQRDKSSIVLAMAVGALVAAFTQVYTELTLLALGMLISETLVRVVLRQEIVGSLRSLALALGTAFLVLLATGQLGYLSEITGNQFKNIVAGAAGGSFVYEQETRLDVIGSVAGFPWLSAHLISLGAPLGLTKIVVLALASGTILFSALAGAWALVVRDHRHATIIVAAAAGGLVSALLAFYVKDDVYLFQKAMTNAAPFSFLLLGLAASYVTAKNKWLVGGAAIAAMLVCIQLVFPSIALARDSAGLWPQYAQRFHQGRNYDLSDIRQRLDEVCPCDLLVNVPPQQDWWYAAYISLSLARYEPYYQMGVMHNNAAATLILPQLTPRGAPQYAIIAARDDYVGIQRLGRLMYDSRGLRLYEITSNDPAVIEPRPPAQ